MFIHQTLFQGNKALGSTMEHWLFKIIRVKAQIWVSSNKCEKRLYFTFTFIIWCWKICFYKRQGCFKSHFPYWLSNQPGSCRLVVQPERSERHYVLDTNLWPFNNGITFQNLSRVSKTNSSGRSWDDLGIKDYYFILIRRPFLYLRSILPLATTQM